MSFLMMIHVLFGTIAVLAGFVAMCAPKGKQVHLQAGKTYVVSMLLMAFAGGVTAVFLPQAINVFASLLTCYLVLTSWRAGHQQCVTRGRFELVAFSGIFLVTTLCLGVAGYIVFTDAEDLHGFGADAYLTIGLMALVATLADINLLVRGKLVGKQRIIRHLWRMCLSYFIAAGSLFEGPGMKAFPPIIQDSGALAIPVPLVMLFTLYWLIKMQLPKRRSPLADEGRCQ